MKKANHKSHVLYDYTHMEVENRGVYRDRAGELSCRDGRGGSEQ